MVNSLNNELNELVSKLPTIPLNQYFGVENSKSIELNGISAFGQKHG
jgi:hypothetical protein